MPEDLYHPDRVYRVLAEIDAAEDEADVLAIVAGRGGRDEAPPEVLVRLLRRCRSEPSARLERAVLRTLVGIVHRWVVRRYYGLSPEDREDLSQDLLLVVSRAVAATTAIDWWEARFFWLLEKAAADGYEKLLDKRLRGAIDLDDNPEVFHDKGEAAHIMAAAAVGHLRLAEILDPDELVLVYPLFLSTIPLCSQKAKLDLVRFLGVPEGTLREKKTSIGRKLQAALEETSP